MTDCIPNLVNGCNLVAFRESCDIKSLDHCLGVLIEGLHICRQNLSTVCMTKQLSEREP